MDREIIVNEGVDDSVHLFVRNGKSSWPSDQMVMMARIC